MNISENDLNLVNRCIARNSSAQAEFIEIFKVKIFRVCLRITGVREDAEEAMNDGFQYCLEHMEDFLGKREKSLIAWVFKIAVTSSLKRIRIRPKQKHAELQENMWTPDYWTIDQKMSLKEILFQIDLLSEPSKTILRLYYLAGARHKKIGKFLGISENAVQKQIQKALISLRETLEV